jgi:hypothetical protein
MHGFPLRSQWTIMGSEPAGGYAGCLKASAIPVARADAAGPVRAAWLSLRKIYQYSAVLLTAPALVALVQAQGQRPLPIGDATPSK